jgi:hypothetical protein
MTSFSIRLAIFELMISTMPWAACTGDSPSGSATLRIAFSARALSGRIPPARPEPKVALGSM